MSQPFSGMPDPGSPSPFRRRSPQSGMQENLREMWQEARRRGERAMRAAQRHGGDLWRQAKRHPRALGITGAAVAVTLVGAYALSASNQSLCPSGGSKAPRFLLLMDQVPHPTAGSEVTINYDVCGLRAGTPIRGRVRLIQALPPAKKSKKKKPVAKPKVVVVNFQDKADGPADRRQQELQLGSAKPGTYTLELSVTDNAGRERKRLQKLVVKAQ
jgi:hypothetical protein